MAQTLKKVRSGGAPVLDEEVGATVIHRGYDEDSVETVRGDIHLATAGKVASIGKS